MASFLQEKMSSIIPAKDRVKYPDLNTALLNPDLRERFCKELGLEFYEDRVALEKDYTIEMSILSGDKLKIASKYRVVPLTDKRTRESALGMSTLEAPIGAFEFLKILILDTKLTNVILPSLASLDDNYDETQVNSYVDAVLERSILDGVSDIHIFRNGQTYEVAFRRQGQIVSIDRKPVPFMKRAIAVLQRQAKVEIGTFKPASDGKITRTVSNQIHEFRFNSLRTYANNQEDADLKVTMRLNHQFNMNASLEDLFYPPFIVELIRDGIQRTHHGMTLFCGTTGSGKTTGMFAGLIELQRIGGKMITTIEDNPEIIVEGLTQIKTFKAENEEANFDYAKAIKACMRADPDVLLVGEIRDRETAIAAFQVAETGHLALSTMHVADIFQVPQRLKNIGVAPIDTIPQLVCVFIQMLAVRLCPDCRIKDEKTGFYFAYDQKENPCPRCQASPRRGYLGRVPINEAGKVVKNSEKLDGPEDLEIYYTWKDTLDWQLKEGNIDPKTYNTILTELRIDTPEEIINATKDTSRVVKERMEKDGLSHLFTESKIAMADVTTGLPREEMIEEEVETKEYLEAKNEDIEDIAPDTISEEDLETTPVNTREELEPTVTTAISEEAEVSATLPTAAKEEILAVENDKETIAMVDISSTAEKVVEETKTSLIIPIAIKEEETIAPIAISEDATTIARVNEEVALATTKEVGGKTAFELPKFGA